MKRGAGRFAASDCYLCARKVRPWILWGVFRMHDFILCLFFCDTSKPLVDFIGIQCYTGTQIETYSMYFIERKLLHNVNYVVLLYHQPQPFYFLPVLPAGGHDINPCGINTAVTQDICQLGDILFHSIKRPCEEFPQVMRKDL